jgi:hypothetical protein
LLDFLRCVVTLYPQIYLGLFSVPAPLSDQLAGSSAGFFCLLTMNRSSFQTPEPSSRVALPVSGPLDAVRVDSPCRVSWDEMAGGDRVRFCPHCRLNVFNLSAMSRQEAEALVSGVTGRLCVRFFRRPDGTVMTDECQGGPGGAGRLWLAALLIALGLAAFSGIALLQYLPTLQTMDHPFHPGGAEPPPVEVVGKDCRP